MKNNYCTLYIVRHGESEWNIKNIIQGHSNSPLTEKGKTQAKKIFEKLKTIKFDAVFSSDLLRAKQTAEIIAIDKRIKVVTTKTLRERSYGQLEGRRWSDVEKELKNLFDEYEKISEKEKAKFKFVEDMENDEEIISRFLTFLRELAVAFAGKKVLVVSHGATMRTFLIHLGFASYKELPSGSIDNTGYMRILSDGVDFFVEETYGITKKVYEK